jgi:hypothetical protein
MAVGKTQLGSPVNHGQVDAYGRSIGRSVRVWIAIYWLILSIVHPAYAQDPGTACALSGLSYKLAGDTVTWLMKIGAGKTCVRGVRAALVQIDAIKLIQPPEHGKVRLEGPGFVFTAEDGFQGEDSFDLSITGTLNQVKGESGIHFHILIR